MENIRNRIDAELHNNEKKKLTIIKKPCFKGSNKFNERLSVLSHKKNTTKLNKPLYVGQENLDMSKTLIYR